MDQSVKIAAATGVLLGGIALALLFRHESPRRGQAAPEASDRLVLRRHIEPQVLFPSSRDGRGAPADPALPASQAARQMPTILSAMDPGEPPPALARDYPAGAMPGMSRWGTSIGLNLPAATQSDESPQTHKIVDGDTLRSLAELYLGSADRYLEIFEANRDVLPSPEILPIGEELKIPPHFRPL